MAETEIITQPETNLSAEELKFSNLVSKGYSLTSAYREAFPSKSKVKSATIRNYAAKLMTKNEIVLEVGVAKQRAIRMARLAEDRIEEVLTEGNIHNKDDKVQDVSMFMYEQSNGKAMQRIVQEGRHVVVTYDLSGGGEPVPQEILDKLDGKDQKTNP